jgi:alcohol dehydrogenase class IV
MLVMRSSTIYHGLVTYPCTAKAISGLVYQRGSCRQFLRVHHEEREMSADALPVLAVPTTAR